MGWHDGRDERLRKQHETRAAHPASANRSRDTEGIVSFTRRERRMLDTKTYLPVVIEIETDHGSTLTRLKSR